MTQARTNQSIAVVVPALNEEATIEGVLRDFHAELPSATLVVVDNASTDRTHEVAGRVLAELACPSALVHEPRRGKGMAVRAALRRVDADLYVLVDADQTYAAGDVHALVDAVTDGGADMAVGDRHSSGGYETSGARRFHSFGNALVSGLVNLLYRSRLRDVMSGLRVFNRAVARSVPLLHDGFELETEMSVYCLDRRLRIEESPIRYRPRPDGSESKLHTFRDGLRVLRLLVLLFKDYRPLAFFGGLGSVAVLAGLVAGIPPIVDYVRYRYVYRVPLAVLAVGFVLAGMLALTTGLILDTVVNLDRQSFERSMRARATDLAADLAGATAVDPAATEAETSIPG